MNLILWISWLILYVILGGAGTLAALVMWRLRQKGPYLAYEFISWAAIAIHAWSTSFVLVLTIAGLPQQASWLSPLLVAVFLVTIFGLVASNTARALYVLGVTLPLLERLIAPLGPFESSTVVVPMNKNGD